MTVAIALGGNGEATVDHFRLAAAELAKHGRIRGTSSLYRTAPVGPSSDVYTNAVLVLKTVLTPDALLAVTQKIEQRCGRDALAARWTSRPLDLDLITAEVDGRPITRSEPRLKLPHPLACVRRFVLDPLVEVWPAAPLDGLSAEGWLLRWTSQTEQPDFASEWGRGLLAATPLPLHEAIEAIHTGLTDVPVRCDAFPSSETLRER